MIKIGRDISSFSVSNAFSQDIDALDKFNSQMSDPDKKLQDLLYSEPYAGNAHAMVYLLDRNPGFVDPDDFKLMEKNESDWKSMMQYSYDPIPSPTHQPTMYWLDPHWKQRIKPLPNGYDGGFAWWWQQTQPLRRYVPNIPDRLFYGVFEFSG